MYMHMLIFVVYHCLGIYCYTSTRAHYCVILLYNPLSENISSVSMYALSGSKATPFNSVFKSFPYSSAFVSYSVGGKEELEEKEQCRKCVIDVFYVLVHLCMQEQVTLSSVFMSLLLDSSIHPVFTHRTLVLVFRCILVYKQPPPSLHRQHYCAA